MTSAGIGNIVAHFTTAEIAERDRIPAWRDYWGRRFFGTDLENSTDQGFDGAVRIRSFPGIHMISSRMSPVRLIRTAALTADGNDFLGLVTSSCGIAVAQRGSALALAGRDAAFVTTAEPSVIESRRSGFLCCILIERGVLSPHARDPGPAFARPIPANDRLLRLLRAYLDYSLAPGAADPALLAAHVIDLVTLMLVPGIDRDSIGNGLAAARLAEARRLVERRCDHPGLDIHEIAAAMGVSTRYLQRLFAGRGTTFTETLLECRLRRASRSLLRPANAGKSIASIAFDAGFSDISYFNRRFKSRYGVSPRDYRHQHSEIGKAENWAANETAGSTP